ncbi:MAG TPA: chorismate-binding protein, partial [Flavobacterium sp.]|nr:chorismate-binding protein [Flavobacterium sp.]
MTDFFIRVKRQLEQRLPFVIYSKPGDNRLIGLFQQNDHIYFSENLSECGFVMAPFGEGSKILIPDSCSEEIIVAVTFEAGEFGPITEVESAPADGSSFIELVTKAKAAIDSGEFLKVVVSRKEPISVANFDAVAAFENLVHRYQNALSYCWFHPKVGMWLGATPEQLVRTDGNRFYSVALAGTRSFTGTTNVKWEVKEQDE